MSARALHCAETQTAPSPSHATCRAWLSADYACMVMAEGNRSNTHKEVDYVLSMLVYKRKRISAKETNHAILQL